jgi:hypothetical protein
MEKEKKSAYNAEDDSPMYQCEKMPIIKKGENRMAVLQAYRDMLMGSGKSAKRA